MSGLNWERERERELMRRHPVTEQRGREAARRMVIEALKGYRVRVDKEQPSYDVLKAAWRVIGLPWRPVAQRDLTDALVEAADALVRDMPRPQRKPSKKRKRSRERSPEGAALDELSRKVQKARREFEPRVTFVSAEEGKPK